MSLEESKKKKRGWLNNASLAVRQRELHPTDDWENRRNVLRLIGRGPNANLS